jgi:hypothetical protein
MSALHLPYSSDPLQQQCLATQPQQGLANKVVVVVEVVAEGFRGGGGGGGSKDG